MSRILTSWDNKILKMYKTNILQEELIKSLKNINGFIIDGDDNNPDILNKNLIIEHALKISPELIKVLLGNQLLKKTFFTDVEGALIFDKLNFQKFVNNKDFLPDSYTQFKQRIGLTFDTDESEFLTSHKDVVLSWPYKDCILEGGQTKDDAKRKEVFWNPTMAPEQVDRLLAPKIFTNFKRYDKTGEHKIRELNGNENLIIKGNNLLALHSLKEKYAGKIKLIYIDPPYNTGSDSFNYNDNFNHSTWLTFMKNRLEIARNLLSEDGSILIHLDWNESHYLKVITDEIFGKENFRNEIIWCYNGPGSPKMKQLNRKHDNILWYSKSGNWIFNGDKIRMKSDVHVGGFNNEMTTSVSGDYSNKGKIPEDWWITFNDKEEFIEEMTIIYDSYKESNNLDWFKNAVAARIRVDGLKRSGFNTEKPYKLMERLIKMCSNPGDIVLDYHLGSGTTCAVAHKMGRRYIGIEQMDYIHDITVERMKKVIEGEQGGISKDVEWQGGGSFVYCELKQYNQEYVDRIHKATESREIADVWQDMKRKAFLNYRIDVKEVDSKFQAVMTQDIDVIKKLLLELLDMNQLYLNYTEINENSFEISEIDKKLNYQFYKK